jgi:hypothetical protein
MLPLPFELRDQILTHLLRSDILCGEVHFDIDRQRAANQWFVHKVKFSIAPSFYQWELRIQFYLPVSGIETNAI